jgi:hypothetical protein
VCCHGEDAAVGRKRHPDGDGDGDGDGGGGGGGTVVPSIRDTRVGERAKMGAIRDEGPGGKGVAELASQARNYKAIKAPAAVPPR